MSQNVFVCLFLLISRGLSALGPVTAGGPDANATITVIPTAKLPHKRRKSKGFLLGSMALRDWFDGLRNLKMQAPGWLMG